MAIACGVDFGTSNSTVGWIGRSAASGPASALLALEDGKPTLPSVVFFNADDEEVSYGRAALAGYLAGYEGRLMRSLKSLLGTSLIDGQTEVAGRALPFRMLLAQFIGEVKRRAELAAGREFTSAVFGRPVYLHRRQRRAPTSWPKTRWPKWRARSASSTSPSSTSRSPPRSTTNRRSAAKNWC